MHLANIVRRHSTLAAIVTLVFLTGCTSAIATADGATTEIDLEPDTPQTDLATIDLAPGDHEFAIDHDDRSRSYRIHLPERIMDPAPLMVALHGGGGNGPDFQDYAGMDAVADREGFVVVYPEGTGVLPKLLHTWNSGFNCCGYALDNDIDDVGFLRTVVESVDDQLPIDRTRVYVTGHSNGAMMAYRFAAEVPDMVTAIAPVAGALSVANPEFDHPIPLLHIHSVDDPRALYDGGQGPPFPGTKRTHIAEPVQPGITRWSRLNGCEGNATTVETTDGGFADRAESIERLVWDCADGADVEHLRLSGSGHGWPGVKVGPVWQRLLGPPTDIIDASEEIWRFVSQFRRQ